MCRAIGRHGARPGRARAGDLDPLQRRRPGHRRLRDGPGRGLRRPRAGHAAARLRRRDAAAAPGGAAHRLGAPAARHPRHPDLRQHGRAGHEGRQGPDGRRRRRPHRLQRRHGQQDRHLRRGAPGQGPRHPVLRRRAVEHIRPVDPRRLAPSRSNSATRARSPTASDARPPPTASTSTTPPSTSPPPS